MRLAAGMVIVLWALPALAQEMQMPMPVHHTQGDPAGDMLMAQASGTSSNPAAAPMQMYMVQNGGWMLMLHGSAFLNQVFQTGPRGGDKLFSTNWIMGMAERPLAGGHLMLRSMLSLEPATVTHRAYPELFQTGETAFGRPIRDAQHPHDFLMELAAEYAYPIDPATVAYLYVAPAGDPALGPVAYPHRASAAELPQATLAHHMQDSTHIAANVITAGGKSGPLGAALSVFHGGEPDERRWNLNGGRIDSWSVRLTADPTPNWSAQLSTGHLTHPELLEPGNVQRTTASVAYSAPTSLGMWSSTLIFGRNDRRHRTATNSWTAETLLQIAEINWITARGEIVDRDELTGDGSMQRIHALTLGYTRDLWQNSAVVAGAGGNFTLYDFAAALEPVYGRSPRSAYVYVHVRSAGGHASMAGMSHTMH